MNASRNILLLAVVMLLLSGCASSGFSVRPGVLSGSDQPWQGQAINMPASLRAGTLTTLTGVVIPLPDLWLADGIGRLVRDQDKKTAQILFKDVWTVLVVLPDGRLTQASAILGQFQSQLFALFPEMSQEAVAKAHIYVLSTNRTSLLLASGTIIGQLGTGSNKEESIDFEKFFSNEGGYRDQFVRLHPSRPKSDEVYDYSPNTQAGMLLAKMLGVRFPKLAKFDDGSSYLVNGQTSALAGESSGATLLDRYISTNHVFIGPSVATPVGAGLVLVNVLVNVFSASQETFSGGVEAQYSALEFAGTLSRFAAENRNMLLFFQRQAEMCKR